MALTGKAKTEYQREYMRRRRAGLTAKPAATKPAARATKPGPDRRDEKIAALGRQLAQAHKRIAELVGAAIFSEAGKLRAEIGKLKSDIIKLKAALQEEPDAAKLRKKVIEQQVEMAGLRQELRRVAKERDQYPMWAHWYAQPKHRDARQLLTPQNYRVLIKALHPDRARHVTPAELAAAERIITALRPLFDTD
jgi:uncharacterized coiled-coil DUF342 family protein